MTRVFVSQPMLGRKKAEIMREREAAFEKIKEPYPDAELIGSFFEDWSCRRETRSEPLALLSKALELLATADVAIFCERWEDARGCRIEHECAAQYGIAIVEM